MAKEKRENIGITLPTKTIVMLDNLRGRLSRDPVFRGLHRSATIEELIRLGIEAHKGK